MRVRDEVLRYSTYGLEPIYILGLYVTSRTQCLWIREQGSQFREKGFTDRGSGPAIRESCFG